MTQDWNAAEAEREYFERYAPLATPGDAHREWHLNAGVPMGTPGCPQDACHPVEEFYDEPTVKCGNKAAHGGQTGYHYSAAEVKWCYASTGRFSGARSTGKQAPQQSVWQEQGQRTLDAMAQAPRTYTDADWQVPTPAPVADPLAKVREAQAAKEAAEAEAKRARYAAWRTIPVYVGGRGYYALEMDGTIHFFKVSRPTEGQHAGKTFVEEQAGDNFHKMSFYRAGQVMDAIAADPEPAGVLYGQKIERCYRCHRTLTDTDSRAMGIGPDCAKKGS